jgi:hypothetical protein
VAPSEDEVQNKRALQSDRGVLLLGLQEVGLLVWAPGKVVNSLQLVVLELLNLFVFSPFHLPPSSFYPGDGLALFLVHSTSGRKDLRVRDEGTFPSWTWLDAEGFSGSVFLVPCLVFVCMRLSCCWRELSGYQDREGGKWKSCCHGHKVYCPGNPRSTEALWGMWHACM